MFYVWERERKWKRTFKRLPIRMSMNLIMGMGQYKLNPYSLCFWIIHCEWYNRCIVSDEFWSTVFSRLLAFSLSLAFSLAVLFFWLTLFSTQITTEHSTDRITRATDADKYRFEKRRQLLLTVELTTHDKWLDLYHSNDFFGQWRVLFWLKDQKWIQLKCYFRETFR